MMKTKEVIKELEHMNLQAEIRGNGLFVVHSGREDIASVYLNTRFEINTNYWAFRNMLAEDEREKVYVLLTKLAETDPSEREEEKGYYLKHKWLYTKECRYLCKDDYGCILVEKLQPSEDFAPFYKPTKFTKEQIEEIKKELNTDLEDFELIEVVD